MFSFKPMSDEEINVLQNRELLKDGVYPFVVKEMSEQHSKNGNPMLKVRLEVVVNQNHKVSIFDYLVSTEKMMFKLKHFCEALGLIESYAKGSFSFSDCIGRSGKCKIAIDKGSAKPDGSGFYPDKNIVKDYVSHDLKVVENVQAPKAEPDFKDDDINF